MAKAKGKAPPAKGGKGPQRKIALGNVSALPAPKPFEGADFENPGLVPTWEVFNAAKATKDLGGVKAVFTDPDGDPVLPPNLSSVVTDWVRIPELPAYKDAKGLEVYVPAPATVHSSKQQRYSHGLQVSSKNWGQQLAMQLRFIASKKTKVKDGEYLWDLILPQDKAGKPLFTDKGRYMVRLWYQGDWRMVSVDDRIPVDKEGQPVLPVSQHALELWPLVLSKALLKLQQGDEPTNGSFLSALCGWVAQETTVRSALAEEAGFSWAQELQRANGACIGAFVCKAVEAGADSDQAAVAQASLASTTAAPEPQSGGEAGSPPAGEATNERVLLGGNQALYSSFMLQPFVAKAEEDEGGPKDEGAAKPKSRGGKKSKKDLEEEAKAAEEAKKVAEEALVTARKKQAADLAAVASMGAPGAQLLDDPSIPKYTIVDLFTGGEEVLTQDNVVNIFDLVSLVYMPSSFEHSQKVNDLWADVKRPFSTLAPVYLYVPPSAAKDGEEEAEGGAEASTHCKILLDVELHAKLPLAPVEVEAKGEGEGVEATGEADAAPAEPAVQASPASSVEVYRLDWAKNEKVAISRHTIGSRTSTVGLLLPLLPTGCVYKVTINSSSGFYLRALSRNALLMESSKAGGTDLWDGAMQLSCKTDSNVYPALAENKWAVLFKYVLTVGGAGATAGKGSAKPAKGGKDAKKDKGGAGAAAPEVASSGLLMPFRSDAATWLSVCLSFMDPSVRACVCLELVNNDTYITTKLGVLETGPLRLPPNENGYTLIASALPTASLPSAKWDLSLVSNKPLSSFASEPAATITEFEDVYKPKLHRGVLRHVLSSGKPEQVSVEVRTNDPSAALICSVYSLADMLETPEDEALPPPAFRLVGRPAVYIPMLPVSKDQKFLLDVRLDPLNSGKMLSPDGKQPAEEDKHLKWTMRCVCGSAMTVQNDKTQEEDFAAIKAAWMKSSAGRDKKAKAARDKYLEEGKEALSMQPTVNAATRRDAGASVAVADLAPARLARDDADLRGQALLEAIKKKRVRQMETTQDESTEREEKRASGVETFTERLNARLQVRTDFRGSMLEHEAALGNLKTVLAGLAVGGAAPAAAAKDKKKGKDKAAEGVGLGDQCAAVDEAIEALADVPAWKAGALIGQARDTLRTLVIAALQEAMCAAMAPMVVADDAKKGKKKEEDKPDPAEGVKSAIANAKCLSPQSSSPTVGLWIKRSERFLVELAVEQISKCLNITDAEGNAVAVDSALLESLLEKLEELGEGAEIRAGPAATIQAAKAKLEELKAEGDEVVDDKAKGKDKGKAKK